MKSDDLMTEARARITWGEPTSSVRGFLIANGISETEANARIAELDSERTRDIRRIGIWDVGIGVALLGGAALLFWLWLRGAHHGMASSTRSSKGVGMLILMGLYGIWRLIKGLFYLIRPQSERDSLTDVK
jgi:hypothetical protein